MSRTPQPNPFADEVEPEPGSNYTPDYREFFERLRHARIERGFSIADMSDEVGLSFELAYEFENLIAPLPFEWLEVWCQVVGVPFEDYLVVYWASEEAYSMAKQQRERESQEEEAQNALSSADTPAPANTSASCDGGWLLPLRAALNRIVDRRRALFSTK